MFENLGEDVQEILLECQKIQEELHLDYIGTEVLLLALYNYPNSICNFLFNEYLITEDMIKNIINKCIFLRKYEIYENKYTKKFIETIHLSNKLSLESNSKEVSDEHLFLSILKTRYTTARKILELLGLDILELQNDFYNIFNYSEELEYDFLINLTKLAKQDKLNPFVGRTKYLERLEKILFKKQKNNPLLIGSAGVGKSAIVEGLAKRFLTTHPEINIYYLDLGLLIAGTKYRGDLEQRITNCINSFKPQYDILFIDEIHNILGAGSSEGSLDLANILKPFLSRSNIKCIGATTLEEYYQYFEKDKALARRFQNVYVEEPSKEETLEILKGIKETYASYHQVDVSDELLDYIIDATSIIHTRKLPDKAIDVLDESLLLAKSYPQKTLTTRLIDEVVFSFLGLDYEKIIMNLQKNLYFNHLKKYYFRYLLNVNLKKTIMNVECFNMQTKELLLKDLQTVFELKDEVVYNLNLSEYQEVHTISLLLGAPPGYVGFDHGGEFTKHILKFPVSIIIITNYEYAHEKIKKLIMDILNDGYIKDYQGRVISFTNSFFIFVNSSKQKAKIGFNNQVDTFEKLLLEIDEVLYDNPLDIKELSPNDYTKYITKLADFGYQINLEIDNHYEDLTTFLEEELANIFQKQPVHPITISYCPKQKKYILQ